MTHRRTQRAWLWSRDCF